MFKYDWEPLFAVRHPGLGRPRYYSPHTIGILTGRTNLMELLEEMRDSGLVGAVKCPTVNAFVLYKCNTGDCGLAYLLRQGYLQSFLAEYPYPQVKGFKKAKVHYDHYGSAIYEPMSNVLTDTPFVPEDYAYANQLINAMQIAGFTPHIKPYTLNIGRKWINFLLGK